MGDRGFDDEIMELELDDELFSSPSPKTPPGRPATMTRPKWVRVQRPAAVDYFVHRARWLSW